MPDIDLIKNSVTKNDYADTPRGGVINFMIPWYPGVGVGLPPEPPQWWSRARDFTLRSTILYEDMWAAAIGIAITKIASSSWEVDSEIPLRARRGQDLINNSDWVKLFAKGLRDYLTTDNGQFIEIVRAAKSPVSSVVGLAHLDSLRCTRTGDPDIPVIYADRKGVEHEIGYENVIALSDLPDPGDTWFGVGNCAASRSYRSIYKLSVIERYVSEKVSGRRPLAIHFVSAVGQRQLDGIVQSAEENAARQGLLSYMGAIVVPLLDASVPPQVSTVPLAEFPDRFNRKEEFDIALYAYADNIGLDIQDLQPLTGQPLGTGAQSQVLDEKAKGKGLVIWKKDIAYELNQKVFDEQTTFAFIEKDYRDQERQAGVSNARATASKTRVDAGITTPAQELQVLVDLDELPNEFLAQDVTGETLNDEEKPDKEASAEETQIVEEMATPPTQPAKETPTEATAKERREFLSELKRANDLLEAALKGGEGSGNFGHSGRPGEVGGSGSGEGSYTLGTPDYSDSKPPKLSLYNIQKTQAIRLLQILPEDERNNFMWRFETDRMPTNLQYDTMMLLQAENIGTARSLLRNARVDTKIFKISGEKEAYRIAKTYLDELRNK